MKLIRCITVLTAFVLLAGCAEKQPPMDRLIELWVKGRYDEVTQLAEKLAAENPDNTQAHRFFIKSAIEKGQLDDCVKKYQELVERNPSTAGYHFALGYSYTQMKEYDAGIAELRKAIELKPDIEYAHYVIGWINLYSDYVDADPEKGLAEWKKEEQLDPKSLGALQVYADRADYYLLMGDSASAEKDYEKITLYAFAPEDITGARDRIAYIRALRDERVRLEADVEENPDDPELRFKLGVAQYKNSLVEEAIDTWREVLKLDPAHTAARNSLGKALLERQQYEEAAEQFRKVVELDPDIEAAYYNLAVAEEMLGDSEAALEHYRKYMALYPESTRLDEVRERIDALEEKADAGKG